MTKRKRPKGHSPPRPALILLGVIVLVPFPAFGGGAQPPSSRPISAPKKLSGDDARRVEALDKTVDQLRGAGKFAEADGPAVQALAICEQALGPDHWQAGDARRRIEDLRKIAALPQEGRSALVTAGERAAEAKAAREEGRYADAERADRTALEIDRRWLGARHPTTAGAASSLGLTLYFQGKHAEAEPLLREAMTVWQGVLGPDHPETARGYDDLAVILNAQGKYAEAEPLHKRALDLRLKLLGADDLLCAESNNNLASTLDEQGKYAEAEPCHRQALAIFLKTLGADHLATTTSSNNLALNLKYQGKYAEAEPLLREALALRLERLGADDPLTASSYNNLARNLDAQRKHAEAEPFYRQALAIWIKVRGTDHFDTSIGYDNLAINLDAQGMYAEAAPLHVRSLAIRQKTLRPDHPDTALAYSTVGTNLDNQGKHAEAEPFHRQSLAIWQQTLGPGHPYTASTYDDLAASLDAQGKFEEAVTNWTAAAASYEQARRASSASGLERAFASERSPLPALAVALARQGQPRAAWTRWETGLARGLLDDLSARQLRPLTTVERGREADLAGQLQKLDEQISHLAAAPNRPPGMKPELEQLRTRANVVRGHWVEFQNELDSRYRAYAGKPSALAEIQGALPAGSALVGWLDVKAHHWACLVRPEGDPLWVKIPGTGSDQAWIKEDQQRGQRLRQALAQDRTGWRDLAAAIARQRLGPLQSHLKGVKHLIVLPSRELAGIPIEALAAALPEGAPGYVVSYVPSGSMLARLSAPRGQESAPPRLLALGDPAFPKRERKPEPGTSNPTLLAQRAAARILDPTRGETLTPLPGTGREVRAIAALFPKDQKTILLEQNATESSLQHLAKSGELKNYRYLHLATHGKANADVAMSSALYLAAEPARLDGAGSRAIEADGRLTAEQIVRTWDLDADLVVLSACQSGLGRYAGGEGYLGFAQALFVKGARSLVLSLWKVDDTATSLLMERFYQNLLGKRPGLEKPLPKARALDEAKQWLRNLSRQQVDSAAAALPAGRRVVDEDEGPKPDQIRQVSDRPYQHPYYWSAFILVGDAG